MAGDLFDRLQRLPLFLDQTGYPLELDREEIRRWYEPLARLVLARLPAQGRELAAVAGPPGSGKTAFAITLAAVVNLLAGETLAVVVGQDGWHYPNASLDAHTLQRGGASLPLRSIKGAPETYDLEKIRAFLAEVKTAASLAYPVYSRALHDPIEGAGRIETAQRVVILEGNYWLLDEPPWNSYASSFDLSIFLEAQPETLLAGLRDRHLRGGKDPAQVEQHLRQVDLPNIERVLAHRLPAEVVVTKAGSRRISAVVVK